MGGLFNSHHLQFNLFPLGFSIEINVRCVPFCDTHTAHLSLWVLVMFLSPFYIPKKEGLFVSTSDKREAKLRPTSVIFGKQNRSMMRVKKMHRKHTTQKQERGKMKMCQLTVYFPSVLNSESNTSILGIGLIDSRLEWTQKPKVPIGLCLKKVHFPLP